MPWYRSTYAPNDAAEWVRRSCAQHEAESSYHFAICDDADHLIGVISLEDVDARTGLAMLGYWVATPATGRGVATAAIGQLMTWAAAHTAIRRVWALIAPDNAASRRVAEANGLRPVAQSANPEQMRYEVELPHV
jgi:ribosomal-protein-alanine N-acetyltransferase